MNKFTVVDIGGKARDIPYLLKELRQKNLIVATEKDNHGNIKLYVSMV